MCKCITVVGATETCLLAVKSKMHYITSKKNNNCQTIIFYVLNKNYGPEVETAKTRENREDRRLGLGRGGVELFRPQVVIGRGPQGP